MTQGQFVVIHGMAGAGKSVLAAESMRDTDLMVSTFGNNVYWLTVGQTGTDTLLTKMQVQIYNILVYVETMGQARFESFTFVDFA